MPLAPTLKDTVHREGTAELYRFRQRGDSGDTGRRLAGGVPLLLVPSPINRWYILDLREGASLVAEVSKRFDTYCFDWGIFEDEDRYLRWDQLVSRLARAVRVVKRRTGAQKVAVLGYCIGGTLAGIHAALHPSEVAAFVNLAAPFDFAQGGLLTTLVDPRWFDAESIADAGNISGPQMQSGFSALHPTLPLAKWVSFWSNTVFDPEARDAFMALESWANDNIAFPAAAWATYIQELYQKNLLIRGEHYIAGERVDLQRIQCPVLSIVASKDTICPPAAATALNDHAGSKDKEVLAIPGGHVGAVVGTGARERLYPQLIAWLEKRIGSGPRLLRGPGSEAAPS